jgi:lipopolysaccharide/colanic/teichoic acid biosynthesis glycosyltransferase
MQLGTFVMRLTLLMLIDVVAVLLATAAAVMLRDNFDTSAERAAILMPYFAFTAAAALAVIPLSGIHRTIWRFSAMPDYLRAIVAVTAIVACAVVLAFAFNRLEGVPRSLPILQINLAISFLIGARVLYRLRHDARQARRKAMAPLKVVDELAAETVLLVGLTSLTETYLQSAAEFAPRRIKVAGILGRRDRHVGRFVAAYKVLGLPEDIEQVVSELDVEGVSIKRIVITASPSGLSSAARKAIAAIERAGSIEVQYLSEHLGFEMGSRQPGPLAGPSEAPISFEIRADELQVMQTRLYWKAKRAIDIVAALILLVLTGPLQIIGGIAVAASMGWPVIFWQQRPGLGGRPFYLAKFRTMSAAHTPDGRRLSDEERVSRVGNFLRRVRFDELPQLLSILRGDMSFIGPRPLLPCDQDEAHRARLLVRPGLSGWAQVVGGRAISAEDKAALDVWYVRNASLLLDMKIALLTIPMLFAGEKISEPLIDRAWQELADAGVLKAKGGFAAIDRLREPAAA